MTPLYSSLITFCLSLEPYTGVASRFSMIYCSIIQSKKTNGFHIDHINNRGHVPRLEIMPISIELILNPDYLEKLYRDHGLKLNKALDPELNYEIQSKYLLKITLS